MEAQYPKDLILISHKPSLKLAGTDLNPSELNSNTPVQFRYIKCRSIEVKKVRENRSRLEKYKLLVNSLISQG